MSASTEDLARALLHEGHLLYPYSPAAPKNRHRWLFGRLYPEAYCRSREGESSSLSAELLVVGEGHAEVAVSLWYLRIAEVDATFRQIDAGAHALGELCLGPATHAFEGGTLEVSIVAREDRAHRLRVVVRNTSPLDAASCSDDDALRLALVSTHLWIAARGGALVTPRDPPPHLADLARSCRNVGTWPILVGPPGSQDRVLSSPIILDDHARIAPESPGDLFDAVEIDELLTLHILALTEDERRAMAADDHGAALLQRTLALTPEGRMRLHGRLVVHAALGPGSRVVLRPRGRGDVLDLALAGRTATVQSMEQDVDGRAYVVVTVDDDPGRDLGAWGHRFFFDPSEVERIGGVP